MIDRDEFNACVSTARHEGLAEGEAKVKERYAARYKKIAESRFCYQVVSVKKYDYTFYGMNPYFFYKKRISA